MHTHSSGVIAALRGQGSHNRPERRQVSELLSFDTVCFASADMTLPSSFFVLLCSALIHFLIVLSLLLLAFLLVLPPLLLLML
jgi:hypothetical protein